MKKIHKIIPKMPEAIHLGVKTEIREPISNIRTTMLSDDYLENFIKVYSKYKIGDVLWVREPAKVVSVDLILLTMKYTMGASSPKEMNIPERFYSFDTPGEPISRKWINECRGVPNGCLKEMCRTFLRITDVRIEPLNLITEAGLVSEGFSLAYGIPSVDAFATFWNKKVNQKFSWENNPMVFVYTFEVVPKGEIDVF